MQQNEKKKKVDIGKGAPIFLQGGRGLRSYKS